MYFGQECSQCLPQHLSLVSKLISKAIESIAPQKSACLFKVMCGHEEVARWPTQSDCLKMGTHFLHVGLERIWHGKGCVATQLED